MIKFTDKYYTEVIGEPEMKGCWLVYGIEKNGKTTLALQLAKDLSYNHKVAYISAEEGIDLSFQKAMRRAGINTSHKILFDEYIPLDDIITKYSKPRTADVIFIDNMTIYADELKQYGLLNFMDAFTGKLIVFVSHEERREPYPSVSKLASKMAKVIVHTVGLSAFVTGRFSKGGELVIDEESSAAFWGDAH